MLSYSLVYLQVLKIVRAIRRGDIKFDKPKEEPPVYHLWGDDSESTEKSKHLAYIPAPKPKLPGIANLLANLFLAVIILAKIIA